MFFYSDASLNYHNIGSSDFYQIFIRIAPGTNAQIPSPGNFDDPNSTAVKVDDHIAYWLPRTQYQWLGSSGPLKVGILSLATGGTIIRITVAGGTNPLHVSENLMTYILTNH